MTSTDIYPYPGYPRFFLARVRSDASEGEAFSSAEGRTIERQSLFAEEAAKNHAVWHGSLPPEEAKVLLNIPDRCVPQN